MADSSLILVVEDEHPVSEMLSFILEKEGWRVLVADSLLRWAVDPRVAMRPHSCRSTCWQATAWSMPPPWRFTWVTAGWSA